MEPEDLLMCTQEPTTGSYPEPNESSRVLFLYIFVMGYLATVTNGTRRNSDNFLNDICQGSINHEAVH
jgi:hypothetical protein